jgi:hypothetical protein
VEPPGPPWRSALAGSLSAKTLAEPHYADGYRTVGSDQELLHRSTYGPLLHGFDTSPGSVMGYGKGRYVCMTDPMWIGLKLSNVSREGSRCWYAQ